MKKALIVGYGSAGKRHARELVERGFVFDVVDPNYQAMAAGVASETDLAPQRVFSDLSEIKKADYEVAIIATPPGLHLEQAKVLEPIPILLEKPLCLPGQDFESYLPRGFIWVAFNYRFHSIVRELWNAAPKKLTLISKVPRRELPPWGLVLDHGAHSVDIVRWVCGEMCHWREGWGNPAERHFGASGRASHTVVKLVEMAPEKGEHKVTLELDGTVLSIEPEETMFKRMWDAFLGAVFRGYSKPGEPDLAWIKSSQASLNELYRRVEDGKAIG